MLQEVLIICLAIFIVTVHAATRDEVIFRLYSRENQDIYIPLVAEELSNIDIDGSKQFKFIIHGYTDDAERPWVLNIKDSYLRKDDLYVITVDWSGPAMSIYEEAVLHIRDVGQFTSELITDLNTMKGAAFENFHIVGHSLGAHCSGFTGKNVFKNTSQLVGRITGLDPANPSFSEENPEDRLSNNDALFVDVIHTDAYKMGFGDPLGDVDFYPNGGTSLQPGCLSKRKRDIKATAYCSHNRACLLFNEGINSKGFVSKKCDSYLNFLLGSCNFNSDAIMGDFCDPTKRGIFYLQTNFNSPFAMH